MASGSLGGSAAAGSEEERAARGATGRQRLRGAKHESNGDAINQGEGDAGGKVLTHKWEQEAVRRETSARCNGICCVSAVLYSANATSGLIINAKK